MPYILEQNEIRQDYTYNRKASPVLDLFRHKTTKGVILVTIFAVVVPAIIYYFIIHKNVTEEIYDHTCAIKQDYKIPCGKLEGVTFEYCRSISCCFDNATQLCFHYLPSKYYYFQQENLNSTLYKPSISKSPFGVNTESEISLSINEIDENRVQIILHKSTVSVDQQRQTTKRYSSVVSNNPLYAEIYRNNSADLLLTTSKGATIISDNYWEWSFQLSDNYLFGLGQLLIDVAENSSFTKVIYPNGQDHNTLPVFMANTNGKFHGLIVRHKGPLEVTVLPSRLVLLKSLAEDKLILELSVGEKPSDVREQQQELGTGKIDLWTLGVHICREGTSTSLDEILTEYQESKDSFTFEYESDCLHDNLVMALLEDDGSNVATLQDTLQNMEKSFMLSLPPQMLYNSEFFNTTIDVYYKNTSDVYIGKYLNKDVIYPDFRHQSANDYMKSLITKLFDDLGGTSFLKNLMLTQNWPADESFQMKKVDDFQYISEGILEAMSSTLPWNITDGTNQSHFINHNDYSVYQLDTISKALSDLALEDTFIVSATNNLGVYHPLIVQNIDTSWTNFKNAITRTLYNSLFHYPLVSIPVCGSTSNFNASVYESLCIRWYLMASTSPLFRISSDLPRRDPDSLNTQTATNLARLAIDIRYRLQYYYLAVLNNKEPLTRPMFYDFPDDEETFALDEQYMVGDSILVAHPNLPDQTSISIYLPESVKVWYEFWGGAAYDLSSRNKGWIRFGVVESDWIGFIPEGKVVPLVKGKLVTLLVALECINNTCTASGKMSSDSTLFTFSVKDADLTIEKTNTDFDFVLDAIIIYNHQESVKSVDCIGKGLDSTNIDLDESYVCPTTVESTTTKETTSAE